MATRIKGLPLTPEEKQAVMENSRKANEQRAAEEREQRAKALAGVPTDPPPTPGTTAGNGTTTTAPTTTTPTTADMSSTDNANVTPTAAATPTGTNTNGTNATGATPTATATTPTTGGTNQASNLIEVSDDEWENWDEEEETQKANPPTPSTFRYFKRNKATGVKEVWESPGKGKRGKKVGDYDPETGGIKNYVDPAVEEEERKAREKSEQERAAHEQKVYGNGIVDNANDQVSAVTSGADKPDENRIKLQRMIDELEARHKARMEENKEDMRRSRRNRLMTAIGDGLNAMHRAYTHSRGIQPMPGSERNMSKEWRDRYDKLIAERDRLQKDYLAEQLRIMQHGTAQERAKAYAEWMTRQGDAKEKNAETRENVARKAQEIADKKAQAAIEKIQKENEKKDAEIKLLNEKLERLQKGLPMNPPTPRSSSGGGGGGNGGSSSRSNNSGGSGRQPSVGERVGAIIASDPDGWRAAQKAAGRKAPQSTVLGIYNATHGGSGGGSGSGRGSGKGTGYGNGAANNKPKGNGKGKGY